MAREPLRFSTPIVNAEGLPTQRFQQMWQQLFTKPIFRLVPEQDPPAKGDLVVEATSDTSLTLKYRGSDGVVRSVSLTLA
jgi:hypothetical protein